LEEVTNQVRSRVWHRRGGVFSVEHRRYVYGGTVCACAAGGSGGRPEAGGPVKSRNELAGCPHVHTQLSWSWAAYGPANRRSLDLGWRLASRQNRVRCSSGAASARDDNAPFVSMMNNPN